MVVAKPKIVVTNLEAKQKSTIQPLRYDISPLKVLKKTSKSNSKPSLMQAKKIKLNVSPLRQSQGRLLLKKRSEEEFGGVDE